MSAYKRLAEGIEQHGGVECEGEPEAFFFVEDSQDPNRAYKVRVAKQLCGECPLRLQCLEYALESNEEFGIWGGLTPLERSSLKKERRRSAVIH